MTTCGSLEAGSSAAMVSFSSGDSSLSSQFDGAVKNNISIRADQNIINYPRGLILAIKQCFVGWDFYKKTKKILLPSFSGSCT